MVFGLLPTLMGSEFKVRRMGSLLIGGKVLRVWLLSSFKVMEIHHWKQVEKWKRQGRISMHESEGGEKNFKSLVDFLDFYGLLPPRRQGRGKVPRH